MRGINKKYPELPHATSAKRLEGKEVGEPLLFSINKNELQHTAYRLQVAQIALEGKHAALWVAADADVERVAAQLIDIAESLREYGIKGLNEIAMGPLAPNVIAPYVARCSHAPDCADGD